MRTVKGTSIEGGISGVIRGRTTIAEPKEVKPFTKPEMNHAPINNKVAISIETPKTFKNII